MFGRSFNLFRLFGFQVRADVSWLLLGWLIAWSLSSGVFPNQFPGYSTAVYWGMGIAGAIGLFISIVLHEFSHSLVARRFGIPMKGITLFIFGGVAEMGEEPPNPHAELMVAIAGPLASVVIAFQCAIITMLLNAADVGRLFSGVFAYLSLINFILVAFNMVPAFPLDGGRVLRAILWRMKSDLKWATRVTSSLGSLFGMVLIVLGVIAALSGNLIGGVWWFILGMFLRGAASMSYQQVVLRRALEGEPVSRFMHPDPVVAHPGQSMQDVVENYVYRYHYKLYPVVDDDGELLGCITLSDIKEIDKEEWPTTRVESILKSCTTGNSIPADADAMEALSRMRSQDSSRLLVVDDGHLRGIVTLKDLLKFLSLKVELEEGRRP